MGNIRHCWKCARRIQNKSYVYCCYCRDEIKKPRDINNDYPFNLNGGKGNR